MNSHCSPLDQQRMFDIELGFHHGHKGEGGLKGKQNGHIDPRFMIRKCVRGDSQMTSAERGREEGGYPNSDQRKGGCINLVL